MLRLSLFGGLIALLAGCGKPEPTSPPLFTRLDANKTGIAFRNDIAESDTLNFLDYLYFYNGAGVASGDLNNDGLTDAFFVSNHGENKLYFNKGNFVFEEAKNAGIAGSAFWKSGVTFVDINADGWLDIYVCAVGKYKNFQGHNELFINNKNGTFTEQAKEYGLDFSGFSTQAAFFDYDHDGDLDCYLLTHAVHTARSYEYVTTRSLRDDSAGDHLFQNTGGKFKDVSASAGIYGALMGYGLGLAIGDLDNDGWEDIYVSNDFYEDDYFYHNNKNGTFTEIGKDAFAHTSRYSMGNDMADVNNDGWLDIITTDMFPEDETVEKASMGEDTFETFQYKQKFGYQPQFSRNCLQINQKTSQHRPIRFADAGVSAGVAAADWAWSPLLADFDNDGVKDLFITNGIEKRPNNLDYIKYLQADSVKYPLVVMGRNVALERRVIGLMPSGRVPNCFFRGIDGYRFEDRSAANGFTEATSSNGSTYADFDNDGDLDLLTNDLNGPAGIFRNDLYTAKATIADTSRTGFLKVKLSGSGGNTFGLGAKVLLKTQGKTLYQHLSPTRGFMSSVEPNLLFGLGKAKVIDSLIVLWPLGKAQIITKVKPNTTLTLRESDATLLAEDILKFPVPAVLFEPFKPKGLDFIHKEDVYYDFSREGLIPFKVSTEGPALAVGDLNADGLDDCFVGGAERQSAAMFLQQPDGSFLPVNQALFLADSASEDTGALFFDADGDKDLDLYVASGGNGYVDDTPMLLDRLYFNNGKGTFTKSTNALPQFFGQKSCVKATDFDNDGDLDLFVGGRVVPYHYGQTPRSFLLQNNGKGKFTDVTENIAPDLAEAGMVTDASWADFDKDGDADLLVVGDWMAPQFFENQNNKFKKVSPDFSPGTGLDPEKDIQLSGFWQCVTAADFDKDGDTDYVLGNIGLNSKLHRKRTNSLKMWLKDLDNNDKLEQIIGYKHKGEYYPINAKDEIGKQIPAIINKRFPSYALFAGKSINQIFSDGELNNADIKEVNQFASVWLENTGEDGFRVHALPAEAQWSKIFSFSVDDFNADGNPDILTGGNFYGVSTYQGRYDTNDGLLLLGNGKGGFVADNRTGFFTPGEVRNIQPIRTPSGKGVVVARSNDSILFFKRQK